MQDRDRVVETIWCRVDALLGVQVSFSRYGGTTVSEFGDDVFLPGDFFQRQACVVLEPLSDAITPTEELD